jgi:hypothetical protein
MGSTSEAPPVAVAREVIPFRERKGDIVLWIFFLVNVLFVTYQADIEQLVIRDPDNFTYPDLASRLHDRLPALVFREVRPAAL